MRWLETIEKEMGYCEVKLERERRLRTQELYLRADVEAFDEILESCGTGNWEEVAKSNCLAGYPLLEVPKVLRQDREAASRIRESFLAIGTRVSLSEIRQLLANELDSVQERLRGYRGFQTRRLNLMNQREKVWKDLGLPKKEVPTRAVEHLHEAEAKWNATSEDYTNVGSAAGFMDKNLDYLRSARNFLLRARASFDVHKWCEEGIFSDLFKHSDVGRVFEMVEGADVNLRLAGKELAGVSVKVDRNREKMVLGAFLRSLFEDLFLSEGFWNTKSVLERAEQKSNDKVGKLRLLNERLETDRFQKEGEREKRFVELGDKVKQITLS